MRTSILLVLVCLVGVACGPKKDDPLPCPLITQSQDAYNAPFERAGPITFGQSKSHALKQGQFALHIVQVPKDGDLQIQATVTLDSGVLKPTLYIYGPRNRDGRFDTCVAEQGLGESGVPLTLTYDVATGDGGEYAIVVGTTNPREHSTDYSLAVECSGTGCERPTCPGLEQCDQVLCPGGFIHETLDSGLSCPTCTCEELQCGPFQKLVFDKCVCDCPAPKPNDTVCGVDGKTWPSVCHATCMGVAIANDNGACDSVCEPLKGCDKKCDFGFKVVDGCKVCECATECDAASGHYAPVCGDDGLTYTNAAQAKCRGQGVAYVGHCLPYCRLPENCDLSCEFGLVPRSGLLDECFECKCMEATEQFNGKTCDKNAMLSCAQSPKGPGGISKDDLGIGIVGAVGSAVRVRTFINQCAAEKAGWKHLASHACSSAACKQDGDCQTAKLSYNETHPSSLDGSLAVSCAKPSQGGPKQSTGICKVNYKLPKNCDDCPSGTTCKETVKGPKCAFDCNCLNGPASLSYEPVCVNGTTYFNACFAYCASDFPIEHPGACCTNRTSAFDLVETYVSIEPQCVDQSLPLNMSFDTQCPAHIDQCVDGQDAPICCKNVP